MYTNPIFDDNFPDPTVIGAPDGWYYAYGTQTRLADGRIVNIQVARSCDLVAWELLGDALPQKPAWAAGTQKFWAPHVSHAAGRYYLYYSARPDDAPDGALALAVAVANAPAGPFVDCGQPLRRGPGFTCIDPMAYDDLATGQCLLYWGSGFGPLWVQALADDRVSFALDSEPQALVWPSGPADDAANYHRLIEGSWVHQHGGWYYLFFSGDNCCGPRAHYAVLVARSRAATGPYETRSAPVLAANAHWLAPGHNCVVTDAAGHDWLAYHAIDPARPTFAAIDDSEGYARRALLLDRLDYGPDGWPWVAGGGPSWQPQPAPAGLLVP